MRNFGKNIKIAASSEDPPPNHACFRRLGASTPAYYYKLYRVHFWRSNAFIYYWI